MPRKGKPKTGEARKTRQPFAIDKLPSAWRDQIIALRARWLTWEQIEEETKNFPWAELEKADPETALSHFADKRIPQSTLHRWYDVRVEQELEAAEEDRRVSEQFVDQFAALGFGNLDESVKNALTDAVFKQRADPEKFQGALLGLGLTLTRFKRTEIAKERLEVDKRRVDVEARRTELMAAKLLGLKEEVSGKKKMTSEELTRKLDEIYDIARPNA